MTRKYWESVDEETVAIQPGAYDVEVTGAREIEESKLIYMDLLVLRGPEKGSVTSIPLYCPEDAEPAVFYFKKKSTGFANLVKKAISDADDGSEIGLLATLLVGARFNATLGVQTKGAYAGNQELIESRPIDGASVTPIAKAPSIEDSPAVQVIDTPTGPVPGDTDDDELPF